MYQLIQCVGPMHLRSIAEPHAALIQAFEAGEDLVLDLSGVEEADLTFVQLILAAQRSAGEQGLVLTLSAPAPEPVMQILERGGFISSAPDARRNFWLAH